jgi:hypothetical protein
MKTTFGGFSLMPPENQASVGHAEMSTARRSWSVNEQRTNRAKEL